MGSPANGSGMETCSLNERGDTVTQRVDKTITLNLGPTGPFGDRTIARRLNEADAMARQIIYLCRNYCSDDSEPPFHIDFESSHVEVTIGFPSEEKADDALKALEEELGRDFPVKMEDNLTA